MKKIFALLCALLLVLTLAGCNTKEESQPKQPKTVYVPDTKEIAEMQGVGVSELGTYLHENYELEVNEIFVHVDDADKEGKVLAQNPIKGVSVEVGTKINVYVGTTKQVESESMQ